MRVGKLRTGPLRFLLGDSELDLPVVDMCGDGANEGFWSLWVCALPLGLRYGEIIG